ncbi:hypothetical protein, partial [Crocosphaera sp. XPORK-15E]|uniref:hypothetical protein n=1 Tax=Crocosphaera sp. XPORK-15E TaxID=3110247 RepID=UPI002B1EAF7F
MLLINSQPLKFLTMEPLERLNGMGKLTTLLMLPLLSMLMNPQLVKSQQLTVNSNQLNSELPCLNSTPECVDKLTQLAVKKSLEIEALNGQIGMLGDRDQLLSDRIDYTRSNQWVNLLENPMTNPVGFIQNIFGGGNYQRSEIAITDLEIKKSQLEAYGADLTRRKAEVEGTLKQEILTLVLSYERETRQQSLLLSQVENQNILSNVVEIDYRYGGSSTESYLASIEKQEKLQSMLAQSGINQQESVRKLEVLVGL